MFKNSIDNKEIFTNNEGIDMVNLTDSIFGVKDSVVTCSFYKVKKNMEMRPDLMSIAAYGEEGYTEMIIKYSQIDNPFAIEEGDIIDIDIDNLSLNLRVSEEELAKRRAKWQPREPKVTTGYLARYASMVTSGNRGAILEIPGNK